MKPKMSNRKFFFYRKLDATMNVVMFFYLIALFYSLIYWFSLFVWLCRILVVGIVILMLVDGIQARRVAQAYKARQEADRQRKILDRKDA